MQSISKDTGSSDTMMYETKNSIPSNTAIDYDHKKRVAIITMFYGSTNYGGVLQAYALYTIVKSLGFECEIIQYAQSIVKASLKSVVLKKYKGKGISINTFLEILADCYRYLVIIKTNLRVRVSKKYMLNQKLKLRINSFSEFTSKHLRISPIYTKDTIENANSIYDIFICGSDQIWNKGFDSAYFLDFVSNDKPKIAYAPSISANQLTKEQINYMQPLLDKFTALSVREIEPREILNKAINKDVKWVLDPTLLLSAEYWQSISSSYPINRPYILCYILGSRRDNWNYILKLMKIIDLPIVTFPFVAGNTLVGISNGDVQVFDAGPSEFLSLVRNAEYVITDSFHGLVFSIIFEKKFIILNRNVETTETMTDSRIATLLELSGLENRLIHNSLYADITLLKEEIDYEKIRPRIEAMREESLQFLIDALKQEK